MEHREIIETVLIVLLSFSVSLISFLHLKVIKILKVEIEYIKQVLDEKKYFK